MKKRKRPSVWMLATAATTLTVLLSFQTPGPSSQPYTLNYPAYFGGRFTIPENNPMTQEGVALGRMLFYEPRLSGNNRVTCATCHQQKLAFTDGKAFSAGVDGTLTKRSSMSLSNLLWVRNLFWDGRVSGLEAQAVVPLTDPHEMGQSLEASVMKLKADGSYREKFAQAFGSGDITGENLLKALAQFERTLISGDSRYDKYLRGQYQPTAQELRGIELFMTPPSPQRNIRGANCGHCHGTPKTFVELFHNNGLDTLPKDAGREAITGQAIDRGRFRVPTLRNISLTAPYMHDGRFATLTEVLNHYNEHVQPSTTLSPFIAEATNAVDGKSLMLTETEKGDLLVFLQMLTDSAFVNNPDFSNPHFLRSTKP
ncbi:cytochrome c peroxidase [Chryseolinea serpens]|uniref:Cytochrome c peroxidase n=1 Tax=Chryseolinea serpens TaxID=947013 RepID=A0A1M5SEY0_9BACT|nr:cytochrome c peroxidase [Chryseolinea serpens]SHH37162.1 cytochrome c peroxidase [Chryseolinea serpens]